MAVKSILNNNEENVIGSYDLENELFETFDETMHTINIDTGKFSSLKVKYRLVACKQQLDLKVFGDTGTAGIPEEPEPGIAYILGYDVSDMKHCVAERISEEALAKAMQGAYLAGLFVKQDIYDILKQIFYNICAKYYPSFKGFKQLLMHSNSIIYRNGLTIAAVKEAESEADAFFETTYCTEASKDPALVMNFNSKSCASVGGNLSEKIFGIEDGLAIAAGKTLETFENLRYDVVLANNEMDNVIVLHLTTNGYVFQVVNVEILPDFRNAKQVLSSHYNNLVEIMNALFDYNIRSHSEDLLSLID